MIYINIYHISKLSLSFTLYPYFLTNGPLWQSNKDNLWNLNRKMMIVILYFKLLKYERYQTFTQSIFKTLHISPNLFYGPKPTFLCLRHENVLEWLPPYPGVGWAVKVKRVRGWMQHFFPVFRHSNSPFWQISASYEADTYRTCLNYNFPSV